MGLASLVDKAWTGVETVLYVVDFVTRWDGTQGRYGLGTLFDKDGNPIYENQARELLEAGEEVWTWKPGLDPQTQEGVWQTWKGDEKWRMQWTPCFRSDNLGGNLAETWEDCGDWYFRRQCYLPPPNIPGLCIARGKEWMEEAQMCSDNPRYERQQDIANAQTLDELCAADPAIPECKPGHTSETASPAFEKWCAADPTREGCNAKPGGHWCNTDTTNDPICQNLRSYCAADPDDRACQGLHIPAGTVPQTTFPEETVPQTFEPGPAGPDPPPTQTMQPINKCRTDQNDCYKQCQELDKQKNEHCKELNRLHVEAMKAAGCKGTKCSTKPFGKTCRKRKAKKKKKKRS